MNPKNKIIIIIIESRRKYNHKKRKEEKKREKKVGKLGGKKTNHSFYRWVLRFLWQFFLNFSFKILSFINPPSLCPPFNFKRFFPMWVCG